MCGHFFKNGDKNNNNQFKIKTVEKHDCCKNFLTSCDNSFKTSQTVLC